MRHVPEKLRHLPDSEWLQLLVQSVETPIIDGFEFPRFPSAEVQSRFVGSAYSDALGEAFQFYQVVKGYSAALGMPIRPSTPFLDFGCGWGRFLRFFWKDVEAENLYGCDVLPYILEVCRETNVPGQLAPIEPLGRLPYADNTFEAMMAYSVFTHLPAHVHEHWMREFTRVSKPGCVACFTVEPRRFLDFVASIPEDATSGWHVGLRRFAPQVPELLRRADAGELAYLPTGGGAGLDAAHYGDAVVPRAYLEKTWGPKWAIREYIDDPNRFWQAVVIAQRV